MVRRGRKTLTQSSRSWRSFAKGRLWRSGGGVFATLDAERGDDPDERDNSDDGERDLRAEVGERDAESVGGEGAPVFQLYGEVCVLEGALDTAALVDGEAEEHEAEPGEREGSGIHGDGEAVHLFVMHIERKEGQQREAEEPDEVGPEDSGRRLADAVDEQMMVEPVDADEGEGESVNAEGRQDFAEAGEAVGVRDFEFEHHDGDDDGDNPVGEGFETRRGESVGHGCLVCRIYPRC